MKIKAQTTYVTRHRIVFYKDLYCGPDPSLPPVGDSKGPTVALAAGVKVCVACGGSSPRRALMTTPTRSLGVVYAWMDLDELCPLDQAETEGISPFFA